MYKTMFVLERFILYCELYATYYTYYYSNGI